MEWVANYHREKKSEEEEGRVGLEIKKNKAKKMITKKKKINK
jgi:hypothetical protein